MKKFLLAPILTIVMVAAAVLGLSAAFLNNPETAKAEPVVVQACNGTVEGVLCIETTGGRLRITTLGGVLVLDQPLPKVTVSGPTITVPLPRVTVTRPPVTVTLPRVTVVRPPVTVSLPRVTLPGVTTTVRLPGATETVRLPGQTMTPPVGVKTVIVPTPGATQTLPVAVITTVGPNGQTIQTSVTITPSPLPGSVTTKPVVREKEIRVSVPAAIGIGVGVLLLGLILGLLAIYVAYAIGYKDSENAERTKWQAFRDEIFGKKDEGEN